MAEILAGEEIISAKEALESELSSHKIKRAQAIYTLIRLFKNDTTNPASQDSLIVLLQNQSDLSLKYLLSFEYLRKGDTNNLNSTLSAIPNSFTLSSQQTIVHNDYLSYFGVMKKLMKHGKNIYTMDSLSLVSIQTLYSNGTEPVKSCAQNILIARGSLTYHEPILLPDGLKSERTKKQYKTGKFIEKSYMKVFPNPARKYVIVEYNLKERYRKEWEGALTLTDIRGHEVFHKVIRKSQDQELINTSGLIAGTYICTLKFKGDILDAKKIVIVE